MSGSPLQAADFHRSRTTGRLLLVSAAVLWSLSGLIVKHPALASIPVAERSILLACGRGLFAAAAMAPFVRWRAAKFRPAYLPMIAAFCLMNVLFVAALTRTSAAAAIFLQYTCTVWAFVLGWLLLSERILRGNVVALVFALVGIVWIVAADWTTDRFFGNLLALGSGLSLSGVFVGLRRFKSDDAVWLTFLNHAFSGIVLLPWMLASGVSMNSMQWSLTAVLGVVQMGIPYLLFARGLKHVTVQEASLIALLEPVLNPILVLLFWREHVGVGTWIGGTLILTGLAIRYAVFPTRDRAAEE